MKKKIALILTLCLCFTLVAGCGKKNKSTIAEKGTSKHDLSFNPSDYVTLGDYKNLESYNISYSASDEEVEERINENLEEAAEYTDITDRGAEDGDFITFDYSCTVDGKDVEDCKSTDYEVQLGNGEFDETIEEKMVGKKSGESFTCEAEISEDLSETNAGDKGQFKITVTKVQEEKIPELTEEFVKANSDSKSVDEYKEEVKKEVINTKKEENEETLLGDLVTKAVDNCTFKDDYPKDLYESCKTSIDESLQYNAEMFGMEVSDLLSYFYGMSEDDLPDEYLNETHTRLFIYALAEKESLFPTDKQYDEYAKDIAEEYEYDSVPELEKDYGKDMVIYEAVRDKVSHFLYENATKKDITEEEYNAMNNEGEEAEDGESGMEIENSDSDVDIEEADEEEVDENVDEEELDDSDSSEFEDLSVDTEEGATEESADAPKEEVQE